MSYDRDEDARRGAGFKAMMRGVRRDAVPGVYREPRPDNAASVAINTTALVMATLSAHASHLPEHVIKAAAIAAGNATLQRTPE